MHWASLRKTAASLILLTTGCIQWEYAKKEQTDPAWCRGLLHLLTSGLPVPQNCCLSVPSTAFCIQTLTPTWRVLNTTSLILLVPVKAKQPTAASTPDAKSSPAVPICLPLHPSTRLENTERSAHTKLPRAETSERELLYEPRGQQLAYSPTKLRKCLLQPGSRVRGCP